MLRATYRHFPLACASLAPLELILLISPAQQGPAVPLQQDNLHKGASDDAVVIIQSNVIFAGSFFHNTAWQVREVVNLLEVSYLQKCRKNCGCFCFYSFSSPFFSKNKLDFMEETSIIMMA